MPDAPPPSAEPAAPRPPARTPRPGQRADTPGRLKALAGLGLTDPPGEAGATGSVGALAGAFDGLARTAARLLGVPQAFVTLVEDETQLLLGAHGLPDEGADGGADGAAPDRTPLSQSLCVECVERGRSVAIGDAAADPAWADHPAVRRFGVGAYLGVPLTLPSGWTAGSLCGVSDRPRRWTAEDAAALEDLAAVTVTALAAGRANAGRRRALAQLRASEQRLRDIADTAGEMLWEVDAEGRFTLVTAPAEGMYGRPVSELLGRRPWELYNDPGESERVRAWYEDLKTRREPFRGDAPPQPARPDGSARWIRLSGPADPGRGAARSLGYRGAGLDVTEERRSAQAAADAALVADRARRDRTLTCWSGSSPTPRSPWRCSTRDMRYLAHSRRWVEAHGMPPATSPVRPQPLRGLSAAAGPLAARVRPGVFGGREPRSAADDPFVRNDGSKTGGSTGGSDPWRDATGQRRRDPRDRLPRRERPAGSPEAPGDWPSTPRTSAPGCGTCPARRSSPTPACAASTGSSRTEPTRGDGRGPVLRIGSTRTTSPRMSAAIQRAYKTGDVTEAEFRVRVPDEDDAVAVGEAAASPATPPTCRCRSRGPRST